jgi:hypothetical protein
MCFITHLCVVSIRRCVVLSQELHQRGFTIFPNGCSVESAVHTHTGPHTRRIADVNGEDDFSGGDNVNVMNKHFGALQFTDLVALVDEDMLHLTRLFTAWMVRYSMYVLVCV